MTEFVSVTVQPQDFEQIAFFKGCWGLLPAVLCLLASDIGYWKQWVYGEFKIKFNNSIFKWLIMEAMST